uniref:Uncharacterized protein n=1 Tax=Strongyloides papillosus TaxID=174720 RepID=A0A0N5C613_STREA
MPSESPTD